MNQANVIKYISRYNLKHSDKKLQLQDLKKAQWYLEDLITCVHIVQLKALTSIRVGQKQKQIDISIPKLEAFIHKIYIATIIIYCSENS